MAVMEVVQARTQQTTTFFRSEEDHDYVQDQSQLSLKWLFSFTISFSTTIGNWLIPIKLLPTLLSTSPKAYPLESKPTLYFEKIHPMLSQLVHPKYVITPSLANNRVTPQSKLNYVKNLKFLQWHSTQIKSISDFLAYEGKTNIKYNCTKTGIRTTSLSSSSFSFNSPSRLQQIFTAPYPHPPSHCTFLYIPPKCPPRVNIYSFLFSHYCIVIYLSYYISYSQLSFVYKSFTFCCFPSPLLYAKRFRTSPTPPRTCDLCATRARHNYGICNSHLNPTLIVYHYIHTHLANWQYFKII